MKDEAKPSTTASKKDAPKSATKTPLASPATKKVEEAKPEQSKPAVPAKAQEEPKEEEEEDSTEDEEEDTRDNEEE